MKIITLIENTSLSDTLCCEHGLSIYIETATNKILFDTGASKQFLKNAGKLGVHLEDVDIFVLSHGHYDHSGGLAAFLEVNQKATLYLRKNTFTKRISTSHGHKHEVGVDPAIKKLLRTHPVVWTGTTCSINDSLFLFSKVKGRKLFSPANDSLFEKHGPFVTKDRFTHEQNLLITEGPLRVLFSGCAHCGIINILESLHTYVPEAPTHCFGGFHMLFEDEEMDSSASYIQEYARAIQSYPTHFYTCHCTGLQPYQIMKEQMGEQLDAILSGSAIYL